MRKFLLSVGVATALVMIPLGVSAQPAGGAARLNCHGTPGSTASVTWHWTVQGQQVGNSFVLVCVVGPNKRGSAGPIAPGRPRQATDFHYQITVTPAGKKAMPCPPHDLSVTPGFGFSVSDSCRAKDPVRSRFRLSAP